MSALLIVRQQPVTDKRAEDYQRSGYNLKTAKALGHRRVRATPTAGG
jgi:hypothetical protein